MRFLVDRGSGTVFSPTTSVFSYQFRSKNAPSSCACRFLMTKGEAGEPFKQQYFFGSWRVLDKKALSFFFLFFFSGIRLLTAILHLPTEFTVIS